MSVGRAVAAVAAGALSFGAAVTLARGATVDMPLDAGAPPGATTVVPIGISSAAGILGTDTIITFDPAVLSAVSVAKTTLSQPHTLTTNLSTPGVVRISLFGATPLSGGGTLLEMTVRSQGPAGATATLHFASVMLNEGQIPAVLVDGHYCVQGPPEEVTGLMVSPIAPGSPVAQLAWDAVPFAAVYHLYRAGRADLADLACFLPGLTAPGTPDDGATPPQGTALFYLATAVNCSEESTLGAASSGLERVAAVLCP